VDKVGEPLRHGSCTDHCTGLRGALAPSPVAAHFVFCRLW
jgi:hypothetical protein